MKFIALPVIGLIIFALFIVYKPVKTVSDVPETAEMILFWGTGCPHCETVKKYITDNNINKTVTISQLEVYYNRTNQKLFQEKANLCPNIVNKDNLGVPMAFVTEDSTCLVGDQPIINWLETRLASTQWKKTKIPLPSPVQ